jgi:hypothetical protein
MSRKATKSRRSKAAARRVRYSVAVSLDGFIAGPKGEHDWIIMDPALDFGALFREFDTALMGRHTFEVAHKSSGGTMPAWRRSCARERCAPVIIPK